MTIAQLSLIIPKSAAIFSTDSFIVSVRAHEVYMYMYIDIYNIFTCSYTSLSVTH